MRVRTRRTTIGVTAAAVSTALLPMTAAHADGAATEIAPAAQAPAAGPSVAEVRHARAESMRQKIVAFAKQKGRTWQYVAGGAGPRSGDCSGFVMYVVKQTTGRSLPHFSGAQMKATKRVGKKQLLPGDLLFWGSGGGQHASIYIGKGKMIGANNPSSDVVIQPINSSYWKPRFAGAGRVVFG